MRIMENIRLYDYQQKAYNDIKSAFKNGHKKIVVVSPCGSGKSYLFAKICQDTLTNNSSGEILILIHRNELISQHKSLFEKLNIDMSRIRIESVFTEKNHLQKHEKPLLVISDECHLSISNSWQSVIKFYNTYTIGFTATPCRLDGKPLGNIYDCMIDTVNVQFLIENNKLAPFEYYAPTTIDTGNLKISHGDYNIVDLEQLMTTSCIYGDVIENYKKIANNEQCIIYCVNIKHALQVAEKFTNAGYRSACIDGTMSKKSRDKIMTDFKNGNITILCNCGIISEGISINNCSVCILLRPTQSLALNIQQSMRCMRYAPNKVAKIIDCVGNYTRHGLPTTIHDWSLNDSVKKYNDINSAGNYIVRCCPICFRTFKTADTCPYCGAKYPLKSREIKAKEQIELTRITAEQMALIEDEKKQKRMAIGQCKTKADLIKIARERGYKTSWVWIQCKIKGINK